MSRAPHLATAQVVAELGTDAARALYVGFHEYNGRFFAGRLGSPLILITQASNPRAEGDYCPRDVHGLESRIRVVPAMFKRGMVYVLDVLLHEMIHAWQHELDGDLEPGYRGHGPKFAQECNRIGAALDLPPVGVKGRGGLPDCAYWPSNVRPEGYYPAPWRKPSRSRQPVATEPEAPDAGALEPEAPLPENIRRTLEGMSTPALEALKTAVISELERRA